MINYIIFVSLLLCLLSYRSGYKKGLDLKNKTLSENRLLIEELNFRLNLILNVSKVGIWVLDIKTRELNWNKEMFAIYELDPNESACQSRWSASLLPDDLVLTLAQLEDSIANTKEFNTSFRIVTKTEGIRHIKAIGNFLIDDDGLAYKMVGINYDNTSEEVFKSNILSLNRELLDFTSILSHDLQQPTTIASMYLDLLGAKNPYLDPDSQEYFNYVKTSLNEISCILKDLIDLIRVDNLEKNQEVNKSELLNLINFKEILESLNYNKNLIEIVLPKEDCYLSMCNRDIKSLFTNLISNAIKFSDHNRKNTITITSDCLDNGKVFTVSDKGIGIDSRHLNEVIKPFFRVYSSEDYPGTGLGLALCDKIAKKYGGTLRIESKLGVGTDIIIKFPCQGTI
jgi:signal transduction histidine kinase